MRFERVLLVDDEPGSRAVLRHVLEVAGLEVLEASDGEEGLEMVRQEAPDLVVTDIRMPNLSGREMGQRIRENPERADVALVAVTRHPEEARNGDGTSVFDLVLRKPVSASRLWRFLQTSA